LAANEKIAFELQKKKFFTKWKTSHEQVPTQRLAKHMGVSQFASSKRRSGTSSKQRQAF
jgi:hypothetical protein